MNGPASDKLFYRIGEVARLTGLRPSVLRYWETEFPELSPAKSKTGQRLYSHNDMDLLLELKQLLHVERLTIEGTRKRLSSRRRKKQDEPEQQQLLREIREELVALRNLL